ncbi:hypothetical protein [Leptospira weilii]|uniref:hypothetical protein n=1 Tax=Leptospira weilii TaxID=28184 RepID=UPI00038127E3|nr:hypothetical protein [Leptospira weilii]
MRTKLFVDGIPIVFYGSSSHFSFVFIFEGKRRIDKRESRFWPRRNLADFGILESSFFRDKKHGLQMISDFDLSIGESYDYGPTGCTILPMFSIRKHILLERMKMAPKINERFLQRYRSAYKIAPNPELLAFFEEDLNILNFETNLL